MQLNGEKPLKTSLQVLNGKTFKVANTVYHKKRKYRFDFGNAATGKTSI